MLVPRGSFPIARSQSSADSRSSRLPLETLATTYCRYNVAMTTDRPGFLRRLFNWGPKKGKAAVSPFPRKGHGNPPEESSRPRPIIKGATGGTPRGLAPLTVTPSDSNKRTCRFCEVMAGEGSPRRPSFRPATLSFLQDEPSTHASPSGTASSLKRGPISTPMAGEAWTPSRATPGTGSSILPSAASPWGTPRPTSIQKATTFAHERSLNPLVSLPRTQSHKGKER